MTVWNPSSDKKEKEPLTLSVYGVNVADTVGAINRTPRKNLNT